VYQTLVYCKADVQKREIKTRKAKEIPSYIENWNKEPVEKHDSGARVGRNPPGGGKRVADEGDLTPVEGEDTQGQTMANPEELVDLGIVWSYPASPRKARESGEKIGRQEV
jgi:hypothetical protein